MQHRPELWKAKYAAPELLEVKFLKGLHPEHPVVHSHLERYGGLGGKPIGDLGPVRVHVPVGNSEALARALHEAGLVEYVEPARIFHTAVIPNDPDYNLEGGLQSRSGFVDAWSITKGSASIPVAIIDSGVDSGHEDMVGKVLTGWNILTNTTDTTDNVGHGTQCASVVGANTNNNLGVAGAGWNTTIVPVKVTDGGGPSTSDIASAVDWVRTNNAARVLSASFNIGEIGLGTTLKNSVDAAYYNGIVSVFSSGNGDQSINPVETANAIIVTGCNAFGNRSINADYGPGCSLAANEAAWTCWATSQGGGYQQFNGTSVSSPYVAAAFALMINVNPNISSRKLIDLMLNHGLNDIGPLFWQTPPLPTGWLNAMRCVQAVQADMTMGNSPGLYVTIS